MRIWRCNCYDKNLGTTVSWHASKREAEKALRAFQKERGEDAVGPEGVQACDIKAGKAGLILWLNGVFTTDNG